MPPKKSDSKMQKSGDKKPKSTAGTDSKKRKRPTDDGNEPLKTPRRSGRGAPQSQPSPLQLLKYMLSAEAEELCRPEDEVAAIREADGRMRTYSSSELNPFEELLSAVILSRPISHRLGLRSIRTLLNPPYDFTSARAVRDAGSDTRHQALLDARTQHKAKTAEQIGLVADVVLDKFTSSGDDEGTHLQKVLKDGNVDVDHLLDALKQSIKGLGATGIDIFRRRVQWLWPAAYPFVDGRTAQALSKLGLADDADRLVELIDQQWSKLQHQGLAGDGEAVKKRRALVVVLERATAADLEDKIDQLLTAAVNA